MRPGVSPTPPADDAKRAAQLFTQQIHGGVYAVPYALGPAIRIAAILGLCRRPRLLFSRSSLS